MRIVVDANILIAALFGSRARQLILTSQNLVPVKTTEEFVEFQK